MKTKLSMDKEGYAFAMDGGLLGITFILFVGVAIELLDLYWPDSKSFHAPIGTLSVGFLLGVMFCRIAPIWKKKRNLKHEDNQTE